jgi:hypothetical protein
LVVANKNKFFASLKASPNFHSVLDDMSKVVQEVRRKKANARFFLGIRLEFGYAALELPSPKGFPLWWHPGVSYPETLTSVLDAKFKEEFDVYITFQRDMFYFSDGMTRFLNTLPNKQVGLLTVFRKR